MYIQFHQVVVAIWRGCAWDEDERKNNNKVCVRTVEEDNVVTHFQTILYISSYGRYNRK